MKEPIRADIRLVNDGVRLGASVEGHPSLEIDSAPPYGAGDTLSALELFLISLCTCAGGTVLAILKKMRKTVSGFSIHAEGVRRQEPPTRFEHIQLTVALKSPDTTEEELYKAVSLTEEKYCPVWAMVKGNVEVAFEVEVVKP